MKNMENKVKGFKTLSKKKKKRLVVIAAGCLLVLAACYTVFIAPLLEKEQWIYKEEVVERGTLKVGVTESGSLEYGITSVLYDLDLDVSDDEEDDEEDDSDEETVQKYLKIEEVYVSAGQRITEGDALIKFTEDSVSDVRRLLESAVVDAKLEYVEAQAEYNLSVLEAQTDYEVLKVQEEYASTIYQKSGASVNNEISILEIQITWKAAEIPSLEEAIEEAEENLKDVTETYEDAREKAEQVSQNKTENYVKYQKEYISAQNQYENAKSSLSRAKQNLEDANREITSLQQQLTAAKAKKTIDKLEIDQSYAESEINSSNAQITYNAQIESLKEILQEAEDDKDKVQEQLNAFEAFVGEDGCLYADGTGIVTEVAYSAGDRLQSTGVMVAYATPGDMTISVDVTQEDIVDLQVGDKVDITFSAYEDIAYEGSIQSINTTATSEDSNTVSYTVVIGVEGDTSLLYGGMSADIIFVTEQKEEVLYISRKAIVEQDGKSYVYYKTALGGRELKEVVTGISNGVDIEIVSGLEEGDTIYLASRVSSEEEVKSSSGESENTQQQGNGNGAFAPPEGMELPEGFEMPSGGMPSGMPNGGVR